MTGSDIVGHRAIVECTVESIDTSIELRCLGSDDAEYFVRIQVDGAASTLEVGATVTLRYMTWTQLYASCVHVGDPPDPFWFSVRDANDALVVGGVVAAEATPYPGLGEDEGLPGIFAPYAFARQHGCAATESEGVCALRPLGIEVSTADAPSVLARVGEDVELAGVVFTLGYGIEAVFDPLSDCCIEGDQAAMELRMLAVPPA